MKIGKNVSNPMLIGAMELMKADPSTEHNQLLVGELMKANYLSPVFLTPMPQPDEEGNIRPDPQSKVEIPAWTASDGKSFSIAFTDKMELDKWKNEREFTPVVLSIEELSVLTLNKGKTLSGCVVNPCGLNIVIPRELMFALMRARLEASRKDRK